MGNERLVLVRIAEIQVIEDDGVLVALGLGSCVGVAMYDPARRIAGMAHVFLPEAPAGVGPAAGAKGAPGGRELAGSSDGKPGRPEGGGLAGVHSGGPARYAASGVAALIEAMESRGTSRSRLWAKLAGGAQLFLRGDAPAVDVGRRNAEAVQAALAAAGVPVLAAALGGHVGRTLRLWAANGRVTVSVPGQAEQEL